MKTYKTAEGSMFSAADAAAAKFSRQGRLAHADREDAFQSARLAVLEAAKSGRTGSFSFWYTVATNRLRDLSRRGQCRPRCELYGAARIYGYRQVILEAVQ